LKVWDILSGRLLRTLSNHQKTITNICFDNSYSRILTASLDHHVKIYDVQDYKVVHSVKYPGPLLCVGLSVNFFFFYPLILILIFFLFFYGSNFFFFFILAR